MALAYLQRALLAYTLHTLSAYDWEACLEVSSQLLIYCCYCLLTGIFSNAESSD